NRSKALLVVLLVAVLSQVACSGPKTQCTVNCVQNGSATVSATLAAVPFTPPPGTNILSFAVTLNGIFLTPANGGSNVNIPLNATTYVVDLTKLQSDSAFLGQVLASVPAATYNKITVGVSAVVVTAATSTSVTVRTATHGSITATANSSTFFSPNCTSFSLPTTIGCAKVNQIASIDVTLGADGTFTLLDYDPLDASATDWIE